MASVSSYVVRDVLGLEATATSADDPHVEAPPSARSRGNRTAR